MPTRLKSETTDKLTQGHQRVLKSITKGVPGLHTTDNDDAIPTTTTADTIAQTSPASAPLLTNPELSLDMAQ